ncbi:MAG: DEAD/DEAH box helicase family protein [Clostridia bacterium]|nr:DEAD/DEAH box helicase family protein [Clostridia bacterium]
MSNFDFLKQTQIFNSFADASLEAEKGIGLNTVTCSILSRRALELAVKWLYANDMDLKMPYQDSISTLIHEISFRNILDEKLFPQIKYVIKLGNFAVHNNRKISREEAVMSLRYLFNFMQWISYCYGQNYKELKFDESILPTESSNVLAVKEKENLYEELSRRDKKVEEAIKENQELRKQITQSRENKKNVYDFKIENISEAETRKRYIDLELKLAGWNFDTNITKELPVQGMPNTENIGFADYVLFGENGLPLAVVEAKKTSVDARVGQNQAKLYADCIETEYHQRPVIYYTNGYEIYMWDDKGYAPRRVSGFYTQEELKLLVDRRKTKQSLSHSYIDTSIAGREYQLEAVKSVCENFEEGHRKSLLVMATGTGKTRTAISIVKTLTEQNWAKNILFVADRTVLVKQAKNNFTKLLPNMSCCNLLNSKDNPEESRIVFSTYQTMINAIDDMKSKKGDKLFTPGHFDLIIIDEAHRSIYNKYQAIFEYFDGLLVGLTATPRSDVDRNTYRFFEIENNVPTYAYEYEQAVKDGYLVDYHTIRTSTDFMDRGIKYDELPDEEKEEYDNLFEEDEAPEEINSSAINSWLFNRDTIKKLIELLMEKGIKVEGGDKLGKTIIFAKNHKHARKIEEVFNELYPSYKGELAKVIDNQIKYSENLIDEFSVQNKFPQIAISVDMLDTGVDVPEIVNLVFFKPIKSKIKFWQMIGRGTRLCENLFAIGDDKKEFYIFDYCKNFEFFSENQKGIESTSQVSLTEKIFNYKLDLIVELQHMKYQAQEDFVEYRESLINEFIEEVNKLNRESFMVKSKLYYVEQFAKKEGWNYLSILDTTNIKENLTPILIPSDENEEAKRFDSLLYGLQVKKINNQRTTKIEDNISSLASELERLGTIPKVVEKQDLIIKVAETDYLSKAGFFDIEKVREELRGLIQFIDPYMRTPIYSDFEDTLLEVNEDDIPFSIGNDFRNYKKKLEKYFSANLENIVIWKIRHNQKLNNAEKQDLERILFEELGSNKEFEEAYGDKSVTQVVRNIVGLDPNTASEIFSKYINNNRLNMKQIQFVKLLIDYVIKNGTIDMIALTEDPFRALGELGDLFEDNIDTFKNIKNDIEQINANVEKLA